jgi:phosphate uptake regulator
VIKEIFDLFRKDNPLNQAFERSREMLLHDQEMFEQAVHSLRQRDDARIAVDVYAKDQMINAYEREVRRKVFTHLALAGEKDLNAGLVLVSVIIDIERIGDYAKNIVELAVHHPEKLHCGSFEADVVKMETTVRTMFRLLLECLPDNDEAKAREVMSEHLWISRKADDRVSDMLDGSDPGLPVREAVATVLYIRYLKRISAHLKNVASSVVNPFDRIGYRVDRDGNNGGD